MPDAHDPAAQAFAASDALRRLVAASPRGPAAQEVYATLGALAHGMTALRDGLALLADWHADHADRATVGGNPDTGRAVVDGAAAQLRDAAGSVHRTTEALDRAWAANGQTTFSGVQPPPAARRADGTVDRSGGRSLRLWPLGWGERPSLQSESRPRGSVLSQMPQRGCHPAGRPGMLGCQRADRGVEDVEGALNEVVVVLGAVAGDQREPLRHRIDCRPAEPGRVNQRPENHQPSSGTRHGSSGSRSASRLSMSPTSAHTMSNVSHCTSSYSTPLPTDEGSFCQREISFLELQPKTLARDPRASTVQAGTSEGFGLPAARVWAALSRPLRRLDALLVEPLRRARQGAGMGTPPGQTGLEQPARVTWMPADSAGPCVEVMDHRRPRTLLNVPGSGFHMHSTRRCSSSVRSA